MEIQAKARMIRIAPRKTRLVIDLIRNKNVNDALAILKNQDQKAARVIEKVLNQAIANAVNNQKLKSASLIKLFIMATAFEEIEQGRLSKDLLC